MPKSVPECPRVSQVPKSVPRCPRVSQGAQEYPKVSQSAQECPKVPKSVPRCPRVSQGAQEYPRCPRVPKSVRKVPNSVLRCPRVSQGCPRVSQECCFFYASPILMADGAWRSLVAHLHGVQVVRGSNPLAPTTFPRRGQAPSEASNNPPFSDKSDQRGQSAAATCRPSANKRFQVRHAAAVPMTSQPISIC